MKINNGLKLILGSSSASRKLVLEKAGFDFEIMTADIDEKAIRHDDYSVLPLLIANAKADALLPRITESALLVTADQIVVFDGELREKPVSKDEARRYLKSYTSDKSAETISAVVVVNTQNGKRCDGVDIAKTYFKEMPDDVIDRLIEDGKVMNASGAFITEDPVIDRFVDRMEGEPDSVMGLPMKLLLDLIDKVSD